MKTLEIVYKILLALERAMDLTAFDTAQIVAILSTIF